MSDYVTIATTDEIAPGDRMIVELGRDGVIVFNVGGTFYAVAEICSHQEFSLADGALINHVLECPKHSAQFDIRTGQHLCPPAVSPIKGYDVRVEGDQVQIARRSR